MPKPNPFVVSLNQPPKGAHLGQHRRTSPKTHRDPSNGASAGAGGTITWSATQNPNSYAPSPSAYPWRSGKSVTLADYAKMFTQVQAYVDLGREEPPTPPLPYAGIRSGEIIGHRLWWVLPDGLCSLAHHFRWEPGATVEGDLEKVVWRGIVHPPIYGGVYAYANHGMDLAMEAEGLCQAFGWNGYQRHTRISSESPGSNAIGLVRGTVKLWGEVIEHETGWRAQYAKLASIEEVWAGDIDEGRGGIAKVEQVLRPYREALSL